MTDETEQSANDKSDISEEKPTVTSHQLELADAEFSYSVTAGKHEPG